jgi:hypothetical protein
MSSAELPFDNARDIELENRMRNLIWTVSGDYALTDASDVSAFAESRYIAMHDAIWRGAFARFFDREALALYVAKKTYLGANERLLMPLVSLCAEAACHERVAAERPAIRSIRELAF